jgi:predicted Zn-dependent protease
MHKLKIRVPNTFLILAALVLGIVPYTQAQAGPSFIRDAEIENTIRELSAPLFRAVGLEPSDVKIYLIRDSSLNAFVAGGQKMFINTGLLMRSTKASQIIGVIAHETGHISGGHLSRIGDVIARSRITSIVGLLLGGAAIAATGRSDVGTALILGGQQIGERGFIAFSQTQESSADQAALTILDRTGQTAKGLVEFLKVLQSEELYSASQQNGYFRTHPLTRDRMKAVEEHLKRSPYTDTPTPQKIVTAYKRMKAKLQGFILPIHQALRFFPASDKSLEARYGRAIALYRRPELENAVKIMDGLIVEHPRDPYFHELKGQMYFENARPRDALKSYQTALSYLPQSALIHSQVARIQIELNDPRMIDSAIKHLRAALQVENDSAFVWRQLGIAYGRKGNIAQSSLALGEEALLKGDHNAARFHAGRAEKLLPHGSRGWLQARDMLQELSRRKKRNSR